MKQYDGFVKGIWCEQINVEDFILNNYLLYKEDSFLIGV